MPTAFTRRLTLILFIGLMGIPQVGWTQTTLPASSEEMMKQLAQRLEDRAQDLQVDETGWRQPPRGSLPNALLQGLFFFYKRVLSSQDGAQCMFEPSCSLFSRDAFLKLGFTRGLLLTLDRLERDHPGAAGHYPVNPDTELLSDPVERYHTATRRRSP